MAGSPDSLVTVQPTSPNQFSAATSGTLPALETVSDGVSVVALPLPPGNVPYTLSYLLADEHDGIHVIDPGPDWDENWGTLGAALAARGKTVTDVASIIVTHLHPDHLGLAGRLRQVSGAPVIMHRSDAAALETPGDPVRMRVSELSNWGVPADRRAELTALTLGPATVAEFLVDRTVEGGELLDIPGRSLRVIHTPGHTSGHICLREEEQKLIFTGDHVLPTVNPGIGLGGTTSENPIRDYLASLDAVAAFDDHEVLPGHGYRFTGLAERCTELADHHRRRTGEVAAVLARQPDATIWQIAERLTWSSGWQALRGFSLLSALSQTALHRELVRQ
jgi:glyoxylase-like metal-dependent hydrolase (beta-lactamase superfamily II)